MNSLIMGGRRFKKIGEEKKGRGRELRERREGKENLCHLRERKKIENEIFLG
jgi:hypothetical protein